MDALLRDMTAVSARAGCNSLWKTWVTFHEAWFNHEVPVLPITAASLLSVAASCKAGRYKSFPVYLSKAKEHHIQAGHAWTDSLALAARKATTSVLRGLGAARQSAPFDVPRAIITASTLEIPAGGPLGWQHMIVVGVAFIMREIELAYAQVQHVQLDDVNLKVSLRLPVSKRDYRALGCTRTLACLCQTDGPVRADCAYHAVLAQVQLLHDHFGQDFPDGLPLFPTAAGEHVGKAIVVRLLVDTGRTL